jgi:hypothetical protein
MAPVVLGLTCRVAALMTATRRVRAVCSCFDTQLYPSMLVGCGGGGESEWFELNAHSKHHNLDFIAV